MLPLNERADIKSVIEASTTRRTFPVRGDPVSVHGSRRYPFILSLSKDHSHSVRGELVEP